jgi:hypothetical protein
MVLRLLLLAASRASRQSSTAAGKTSYPPPTYKFDDNKIRLGFCTAFLDKISFGLQKYQFPFDKKKLLICIKTNPKVKLTAE